jgi:[FeFe] hydrogenase H-cluster maturation GTPase HydF
VLNKCERLSKQQKASLLREAETELALQDTQIMFVSSQTGENINKLRERLGHMTPAQAEEVPLIQDKIAAGDTVILVIPIDSSAPKGRLILPQQQTIREILEAGAMAYALQETELSQALANLKKRPKLVITDSQVFHRIKDIVPRDIYLTSFSMLFARKKGDLPFMAENAACLGSLQSGSRILISEGCTHHRQCEDIGTVKLPKWIQEFTGKSFQFDFTSGGNFPEDISRYGLIVHCGGCMLNRREVQSRLEQARLAGIPMTNYGVLIAYMQGILERSMEIFNTNQSISASEKQGITGIEG